MWKKRGNPIHFDRLSEAAGHINQLRAAGACSVRIQFSERCVSPRVFAACAKQPLTWVTCFILARTLWELFLFLFLFLRGWHLIFGDIIQAMALARLADEIAEQVHLCLIV